MESGGLRRTRRRITELHRVKEPTSRGRWAGELMGYTRYWRATITGTRANRTTAALTEPNNMPANPPRPWLPTTTSWADSDWSTSWLAGWPRTTPRRTGTSG